MKRCCMLLLLALCPIILFCQSDNIFTIQYDTGLKIDVDKTFACNGHIEPFKDQNPIGGLAVSGEIILHSDSSLVRIILMDSKYNEYLIYETYPLLAGSSQFSIIEVCEETCLLDNVKPYQVLVELFDATAYIKEIIVNVRFSSKGEKRVERLNKQSLLKIERINKNIQFSGQKWLAGETSISRLSYQEKKNLFGESVPNFQGFEYYIGGVFVLPGTLSDDSKSMEKQSNFLSLSDAQYASEFSWKSRHGADWVTPVKHQDSCNSCWAFGTTAASELLVNLYYNRHLDYDLSEQNLVSCVSESGCNGGSEKFALAYLKNVGIVMERCFTYTALDQDCSEMCINPDERIRINNWTYNESEQYFKREIIKGPTFVNIDSWAHSVQVVGYKKLEEGDSLFFKINDTLSWLTIERGDPLSGKTAWICKNSWGGDWGDNGYVYLVGEEGDFSLYGLYGHVNSLVLSETDVLCNDNDGDGYYSWGIGPKPSHCPESPEEADGDDSDPCIGPMDAFGKFTHFTPTPDAKDTAIVYGQPVPDLIASGSNLRWYSDGDMVNLIYTGSSFSSGQLKRGDYTYYVTQTISGCESAPDTVSLRIIGPSVLIPDTVFFDALIDKGFDTYGDNLVSFNEVSTITSLNVSGFGITDLTGIEAFVNLVALFCFDNLFDSLDLSGNSALKYLDCSGRKIFTNVNPPLKALNVSANIYLEDLICGFTQLTSLDLSNNSRLENIDIQGMETLNEVCVWDTFLISSLNIDTTGSSNVYFNSEGCTEVKIIEETEQNELTIYPNPARSTLHINVPGEEPYKISIIDLSGNILLDMQLGQFPAALDISSFRQGSYILRVVGKESIWNNGFMITR